VFAGLVIIDGVVVFRVGSEAAAVEVADEAESVLTAAEGKTFMYNSNNFIDSLDIVAES
jgi:hypothetical protein